MINFFGLRPVLKELRLIRLALDRMNDIRETELAHQGLHIRPAIADTSGPEPEISYVNEEHDYYRELEEELGKRGKESVDPSE